MKCAVEIIRRSSVRDERRAIQAVNHAGKPGS
jgi:hypothetical protein